MPGPENTQEQTCDAVDAASQVEYQKLRDDLTRYGTDASQLSDEFLASYKENLPNEYERLQEALLKERAEGHQNNAVISQAVQDMNQFLENEQEATAEEEAAGERKAKLEEYKPYLEGIIASKELGPKGTETRVNVLSDGRVQISVTSTIPLTITSDKPFRPDRPNTWKIDGLNSVYDDIAEWSDDVSTLQTLLSQLKEDAKLSDTPFYISKTGPASVLLADRGSKPTAGGLFDFGEIKASNPEAFKDFANKKYQEMMGTVVQKGDTETNKATPSRTPEKDRMDQLDRAMSDAFEPAMKKLNGMTDMKLQDSYRNALDGARVAFLRGKDQKNTTDMYAALSAFQELATSIPENDALKNPRAEMDRIFQSTVNGLEGISDQKAAQSLKDELDRAYAQFNQAERAHNEPSMRVALMKFQDVGMRISSLAQSKAPDGKGAPKRADGSSTSPEKAPEKGGRSAWLNRLTANPKAYIFQNAEQKYGGTWINVQLPTSEDVRYSRIQDVIGPEGQSSIGLSPEKLRNTILITTDQTEYRWNNTHGTWENSDGTRLRLLDGSRFAYKESTSHETAPSKAIITLNQAMIDSKITVAHGHYEYKDAKGVTVVQDGPFNDGKLEGQGKETRTIGDLVTVTEGTFKDGLLIKGTKTTTEGATTRTIEVGGDAKQVDASAFDDALEAMDTAE